jgi:tetratricopeptide (TPR) repeat protein
MKKTALGIVAVAVMLAVGGTMGSAPDGTAQKQEKEWFAQAQEAVALGRYDEAIRCYEKVRSINPGFLDVHRFLGDVYMKKGMPDTAIEAYKKALDAKPQKVPALIGLGNAYYQKDMIDESLASYTRALAMQPASAPARVGLGNIYYYKKNDPAQALAEYEKGLALEADHAEAQLNAGMILQKNAQQKRAAHHFYQAGLLFIQAGDRKNALQAYDCLRQTNEEKLIQLLSDALQPSIKSSETH